MHTKYIGGLPYASVQVKDTVVECVIDTGFVGALMLPIDLLGDVRAEWKAKIDYIVGDGYCGQGDLYETTITWFGQQRTIRVVACPNDI